jgi:hypothetical protein
VTWRHDLNSDVWDGSNSRAQDGYA